MSFPHLLFILALAQGSCLSARLPGPADDKVIPDSLNGWQAQGQVATYDRKTVFDYLDGGAEIYLAYGMKSVRALRYVSPYEPSIDLSIFEMEEPDGAFGAFTYERLDPEAGIGQGSEYGGGMLRFWQGRFFVFIQAERETPASREAVFTLGKALLSHLEPKGRLPALLDALPQERLRFLTVRYVLSTLVLKNLEPTLGDNPLGAPERTAAVMGRYGTAGNPERILLVHFVDENAATKGVEGYLNKRNVQAARSMSPFKTSDGWTMIAACGSHAVLILDAPDEGSAQKQFEETKRKLKEIFR